MTRVEQDDTAVDAIKQVLEAEHEAEQALRRCHQQARQAIEDARRDARAIEARADARIHRIHRDRQERIDRLKADTEAQCRDLDARSPCDETDQARIQSAVTDAVADLLGRDADAMT